jgi:hypothetical protein
VGSLPSMSKKRKILILLGLGLVLALCTGVAAVFYYAESPGALKALLERSLSRTTGAQCTIGEFAYSLNPLSIRARDIELIDPVQHFHLEVPELTTELSLQGPFTRRSLVVKHLTIQGPSLNTYRAFTLTEPTEKPATPALFGRLARRLVALLLFQDIQLDNAELNGGHLNGEMGEQVLTMSGIHLSLDGAKALQVSCHGLLQWPSEEMQLSMPHLRLTTDRAFSLVDPEIRMTLKSEEMTLSAPHGKAENLSLETEVLYDRDKRLLTFNSASLFTERLFVTQWNGSSSPALTMHFKADGFLDLSGGNARVRHFQLNFKEIMEATGAFQGAAGARPEARITDLALQVSLPKAWPLLSRILGLKAPSCQFGSAAHGTGNLHGLFEGKTWHWDLDLQGRVQDSDVSVTAPDGRGRGKVSAELQVKGRLPSVQTELTFALEKAELSWKGVEVRSAKAAFSASGKGLDFGVQNLNLQASQAEFVLSGKRFQIPDISAQTQSGTILFAPAKLNFPRIDIHTPLLRNLQLSLDAQEAGASFVLQGKDVRVFSLAKALNLLPPDWQMEGADSLLMRGSLNQDGHWLVESKWTLDQFAFQSPDSRYAGEQISLGLSMAAAGGRGQTKWKTSVEGTAEKGGFLYDRIYIDLNRNSLHFQAHGAYDPFTGTTDLSQFRLALRDLLSLEAEGQLADFALQKPCHLLVRLPQIHIQPAFQLFVKEPFEREAPFLAELTVEGDLMAEMELQKETEGWRLLGLCSWHEGGISGKGFAMEGIKLDLPFWSENPGTSTEALRRRKLPASKDLPKEGGLFIQSISLPFLPKQSLTLRAQSTPNHLSFTLRDPIKTPAGEIALGPISVSGLSSLSPTLVTSVTLKEGSLAPLVAGLWSHPVEGSIRAKLHLLHFDGDDIKTRGDVRVRAFGGTIVLSNLGVSGVFSSTPALLLEAAWKDISLAELTEGTPFEKIEGILKGEVKHLEVVGGEPQRFDLFMETIRTKDIPQKISVRALENISRIGGGASPFIGLAGALTSLFKEFPYDKIAVQASLENDVFRIDGPLKEEGKVYLVKRSGLSGVNVVNQDPGGKISFKDMMKRIKRVTAAQHGTEGEQETPKSNSHELRD